MAKKRNATKQSRALPLALIVVGTLFTSLSVYHNIVRLQTLRLNKVVVQEYLTQTKTERAQELPTPVHINIPWFVDVEIDPSVIREGFPTVSADHASYLVNSGKPGEAGNIIIFGHNKRSILGNIRALKGYEKITLTLSNGSSKEYQITKVQQVTSKQTELLLPTETETLTIYTCAGFFDKERFVVQAQPITEASK